MIRPIDTRRAFRLRRLTFLGLLLTISWAGIFPTVLNAQSSAEIVSDSDRGKLYAQLASDVARLEQQQSILKRVSKLVRPAVVHIEVRRATSSSFGRSPAEETGSGVIVRKNGRTYVLTNRHLIKNAEPHEIKVLLEDKRELSPDQTWTDKVTDIAVMAIKGEDLVGARIGDSDTCDVGDFVLAMGSPFGLNHSVTYGIISATGRRDLELATDEVSQQDFMQTDASINPGNSGGPLVNLRGEVIGINTAIASSSGRNEGIGFSIPINMVIIVAEQLIERGEVVRGYLGVSLDSKFGFPEAKLAGLKRSRGARVTGVTSGSPAEQAKLQPNDIILLFNGKWIDDDGHLVTQVSLTPVGQEVPVVIFRDKKQMTLQVTIANRGKFSR